jgi:hypothetical protein
MSGDFDPVVAVQRASRRAGLKFKLQGPQRRRTTGPSRQQTHAKLTWAQVHEIRRWTRCEGFGLPLCDQITRLRTIYPVAHVTLREILQNRAWVDLAYEPGTPDPDFWAAQSTTASVLLLTLRRGVTR